MKLNFVSEEDAIDILNHCYKQKHELEELQIESFRKKRAIKTLNMMIAQINKFLFKNENKTRI